jgi:hypothetical protein
VGGVVRRGAGEELAVRMKYGDELRCTRIATVTDGTTLFAAGAFGSLR